MDGISESLNESLGELEDYTEDSPVKIDIDYEKLYTNMLKFRRNGCTHSKTDPIPSRKTAESSF